MQLNYRSWRMLLVPMQLMLSFATSSGFIAGIATTSPRISWLKHSGNLLPIGWRKRIHSRRALRCRMLFSWLAIFISSMALAADTFPAAHLEFFESRIRPVLVEHCYKCHNSTSQADGDLALDHRAAVLKGGEHGAIVVPGKPTESRLLPILRHEVSGMKMPQGGIKLSDKIIADFAKWIELGLPDPRNTAPSADDVAKLTAWEVTLEKRKQWWSFRPIQNTQPPVLAENRWSDHPIDRFILEKLRARQLQPVENADAQTLVRRLYFTLIGLPPSPADIAQWTVRLAEPGGYESLVDHLLSSDHFGERWGRHWMDWIRYADSHGSEGDPAIDGAWQYRDYLIRALNADVPFDQLVREHIAGDLLENPRFNSKRTINESRIGTAHWRMVFHGFAPTDALEEKVRFVDDEINTFTKAFLGMTVSCARCHDHKFDPISQRDYYALFGILGSCRPGRVTIDSPEILNRNRESLAALKPRIREALANEWLASLATMKKSMLADDGAWRKADKENDVLHPWFVLRQEMEKGTKKSLAELWRTQKAKWEDARKRLTAWRASPAEARRWNLKSSADYAQWFRTGNGLSDQPAPAGEFAVAADGDKALVGIYPAGAYSHLLSAKHAARLTSRYEHLDGDYELWLRVIGDGGSSARYVVQHYPRSGTVYPVAGLKPDWTWQRFDLTYWNGDEIHIEVTAAKDAPLLVKDEARSWFGVEEVVLAKKGSAAPPEFRDYHAMFFEPTAAEASESFEQLADHFLLGLRDAIEAWRSGKATDTQARLLDSCIKQRWLNNELSKLKETRTILEEYRRLEAEIVVPTRVPGLEESVARDQPLYPRGNHKFTGEIVPRRFLEAFAATPYATSQSGRRQLAEDLLRYDNPLTHRVIVNRLWHHLFGRGIVGTPDNFGQLGMEPTHPELLDFLAMRFREQGSSIKQMIRWMVSSRTWRLSSRPSPSAIQLDPDNLFLSHANVRRLEAEAIRDAMLAIAGKLENGKEGPPVDGNSQRRSIFVRVQRNALDPFLRAFDFPEPFSAVGRRDVTNVPAQSLVLMNDERVSALAADFAVRVRSANAVSDDDRIAQMFLIALGRPATASETASLNRYLTETKTGSSQLARRAAELQMEITRQQAAIHEVYEPVRKRLLEQSKSAPVAVNEDFLPKPIGRWDFKNSLKDAVGVMHCELRGSAKWESGAVICGRDGYVTTAPLPKAIKEKTLEVWVQLNSLDQRGGGAMTIQSANGNVFDSIVFGEKEARQWIAGSNFFSRTKSFNGSLEDVAANRPIHFAIAYHADGRIIGYREGVRYGTEYKSNGPIEFPAKETIVSFGVRHLPAGGNRMLDGRILKANLYDRALTADEVAATSKAVPNVVTEEKIIASLAEQERRQVSSLKKQLADFESQLVALGPVPDVTDEKTAWTDLARAIFMFKEFIFVK